jgi:hypothetical protein
VLSLLSYWMRSLWEERLARRLRAVMGGAVAVVLLFAVVLGVRFQNTMDWTGAATLALALGTVVLAVVTQRSVRLGQAEFDASQRPVLVPYPVAGKPSTTAPEDASDVEIGVRNIGPGPCTDVVATAERTASGIALDGKTLSPEHVGAMQERSVWLRVNPPLHDKTDFLLRLMYRDIAGKEYETVAFYDAEVGGFFLKAVAVRNADQQRRSTARRLRGWM